MSEHGVGSGGGSQARHRAPKRDAAPRRRRRCGPVAVLAIAARTRRDRPRQSRLRRPRRPVRADGAGAGSPRPDARGKGSSRACSTRSSRSASCSSSRPPGVFNFAQGIMVVFAALTLVGLHEKGVPALVALRARGRRDARARDRRRARGAASAGQPARHHPVHGDLRPDLFPHRPRRADLRRQPEADDREPALSAARARPTPRSSAAASASSTSTSPPR